MRKKKEIHTFVILLPIGTCYHFTAVQFNVQKHHSVYRSELLMKFIIELDRKSLKQNGKNNLPRNERQLGTLVEKKCHLVSQSGC